MTQPSPLTHAVDDLPWLQRLAERLSRADADDLVQEALIAAWRQPEDDTVAAPRGWLATVVRNRARSNSRSAQRRRLREERAPSLTDVPRPDLHEDLERSELLGRLRDALANMAETDRAIVVGRFFEGKNATELAQELGMKPSTVRARLRRSLSRLERELTERAEDHGQGRRRGWFATAVPSLWGSSGIKLLAALAGSVVVGWCLWALIPGENDSPALPASTPPRDASASAQPSGAGGPSLHPRPAARTRAADAPATPPVPEASPDFAPMVSAAQRFLSDTVLDCAEQGPRGQLGLLTLRIKLRGSGEIGTIFESVDFVETLDNPADVVDCTREALLGYRGESPARPFSWAHTVTHVGSRIPDGVSEERWHALIFRGIVEAHASELRACESPDDSTHGNVPFEAHLPGDSHIERVVLGKPTAPEDVAACVASTVATWRVPRTLLGGFSHTVSFPIDPSVDGIYE